MQKDCLKLKGKVMIYDRDTGMIVFVKDNIIVNTGLYLLADRLGNNSVNFLTHLAIGDSSVAEGATDTALYSEIFRKAFSSVSNPDAVFRAETSVDGTEAVFTWGEMALFNAGSSGVMFNRVALNYVHNAGENLNVIWEITFARG